MPPCEGLSTIAQILNSDPDLSLAAASALNVGTAAYFENPDVNITFLVPTNTAMEAGVAQWSKLKNKYWIFFHRRFHLHECPRSAHCSPF